MQDDCITITLGLPEVRVIREEEAATEIVVEVSYRRRWATCPRCGQETPKMHSTSRQQKRDRRLWDESDLELMALIHRQYLEAPFYGSRRMTAWLKGQGHQMSRKRVRRLMRLMGVIAIYRPPNTSKPRRGHKVYPYLLRGVGVNCVNQVWGADITYIPMARGFIYLVAIMD